MLNKMNIRLKATVIVAFLVLFIITSGTIFWYLNVWDMQYRSIGATHVMMARILGQGVADKYTILINYLEEYLSNPTWWAAIEEANAKYEAQDPESIKEQLIFKDKQWRQDGSLTQEILSSALSKKLKRLSGGNKDVTEIFLTDKYGGLVASSGMTSNFYQADKSWWQAAYHQGQGTIFLGQVELDKSTNVISTPLALPIWDDVGELIGVCKVVVGIEDITRNLRKYKYGITGYTALVGKNGLIFDHPRLRPLSSVFADPEEQAKLFKGGKTSGFAIIRERLHPELMLVSFAEIESALFKNNGIQLFLTLHQSQREVFLPLNEFSRRMVFWGLILVVFIMLLLQRIVDHYFVKPALEIERALKNYTAGNLAYRTRISSDDEFGAAAIYLNNMSQRLSQTMIKKEELIKINEQMLVQTVALESAPSGVMITDLDGNIVWVNKAFSLMTGYSRDEITGKSTRILKSGRQTQEFYKDLWDTIRAGKVWHNEIIDRCKDGSFVPAEMTIAPVKNANNEIINFIAIKQDITERKIREVALRESEEKFRQLTENIKEIFWLTDPNLEKLYYVSPAFEDHWNIPLQEVYKNPQVFFDTIHPGDKKIVYRELRAMARSGRCQAEFRINRHDGQVRWMDAKGFPIKNDKGEIYRVAGIVEDVTEKKKAMEELMRANEALKQAHNQLIQSEKLIGIGQLAAGVAHEVKNPLAIMTLGMDELEAGIPELSEAQKKYFQMIRKASARAHRVINDLLSFSRTSGVDLSPVKLNDILRDAVFLCKNSAKLKDIVFHEELAVESPVIQADRTMLEQAFFNLLSNAVDALKEAGRISVRSYFGKKANDEEIIVEISDNGRGIPDNIKSRIFEPFFTTKEQGKGTGLGLYIVYMILERHQAAIKVESKENMGTTFIIIFKQKKDEESRDEKNSRR